MITLHITIASIIFSVMFAYRNYWQIEQCYWNTECKDTLAYYMAEQSKAKWHKWQFALQIYIGAVIAFVSFVSDYSPLNSLGHGLLFGSTFWLVFDTLLGYLLTKNIFHVDSNGIGTVYKKLFKTYAGIALGISKVLFFALSVILSLI